MLRGASKATSTTICQKCLKRGHHFTYECQAKEQERPYVSRPSRTQMFKNPKLKPKLTNDSLAPVATTNTANGHTTTRSEGMNDAAELKRKRHDEAESDTYPRKRSRSRADSSCSSSVATISTRSSRSVSRSRKPPQALESDKKRRRASSVSSDDGVDEWRRGGEPDRNTRHRKGSSSPRERGRRADRSSADRGGKGRPDDDADPHARRAAMSAQVN